MTSTASEPQLDSSADIALADRLKAGVNSVTKELHKLIVGQENVIDHVLLSLFAGGNSLIIGVPGLAKTLLIHTISQVLDLKFSRIQFTPDLMPSDITGTDIINEDAETGRRKLTFVPGPIFANIVLADEVNRTPPKTQAALLEAMQEHRVTVQGKTYPLQEPFLVFATQNPIELEGTYPLPEAQLDRFMFHINMDYLNEDDEVLVVTRTTATMDQQFKHALSGQDVRDFQALVRRVPVADAVARYAVHLTRASRPGPHAMKFINEWVSYGASTRAPQQMILAGKARALMQGRYHVSFEDVRALAHPVMRHRILMNFHADSEKVTADQIIDQLVQAVPVPGSGMK